MTDKANEYVNTILFCPAKQHVALIRKVRPKWQHGKWNGIGGHLQVDEIPRVAASRELEEETGAKIHPLDLRFLMTLVVPNEGIGASIHFFVAESEAIWHVKSQTDEIVQVFKMNGLPRDLVPNMNWILQMAALDNREAWPYTVRENGSAERA